MMTPIECPLMHDDIKYFAGLDNYVEMLFRLPEGFLLNDFQKEYLHSIIFEKPKKSFDIAMKMGTQFSKGFESGKSMIDESFSIPISKELQEIVQKLITNAIENCIRNDIQTYKKLTSTYYCSRGDAKSELTVRRIIDLLYSGNYEITYDEKEHIAMGKMYTDYSSFGTTCIVDTKRGVTVLFGTTDVTNTNTIYNNSHLYCDPIGRRILAQDFNCHVESGHVDRDLQKAIINLIANFGATPLEDNRFHIAKVIFNKPATIVFWKDGTKTVVKCDSEKDIYDPEKGLAMCFAKKALGNKYDYYNTFINHLKKAPDYEPIIEQ